MKRDTYITKFIGMCFLDAGPCDFKLPMEARKQP